MKYVVYGDKNSGAFSSEAVLAEAGALYEFHQVSLEKNEQKNAEFLAINPSGKMPALRLPEGDIVTESSAIVLTVADRFPEARLLPMSGSVERAQAYRWLAFMATEIYPMVEICDYPERFTPDEFAAKSLRLNAQERVRERLMIAESFVEGPWFLPSGFSILDIYASMFTRWRGSIGEEWSLEAHIPKLNAISVGVAQRSAIAPIWARHFKR